MRILPSTIKNGNSYRLEIALPSPPETDEPWTRVDLNLRRAKDTENTGYANFTETIVGQTAELELTAASTETWADGVYRYALTCETAEGFTTTIEDGVVDVRDSLDPKLTHNERMVMLLENMIEEKAAGRADVAEYMIADRSTKAMTYQELIQSLSDYKEALYIERQGGRQLRMKV